MSLGLTLWSDIFNHKCAHCVTRVIHQNFPETLFPETIHNCGYVLMVDLQRPIRWFNRRNNNLEGRMKRNAILNGK